MLGIVLASSPSALSEERKPLLDDGSIRFKAVPVSTCEEECKEVVDAYEEALDLNVKTIEAKDLVIQDQDRLINNLREQRNEAIKNNGSSVMDYVWPFLAGAAAATVIIGIRR